MTLRDDVRSMLAGRAGDVDVPETSGTGSDLADLPAELIGTAIGHFADTAPIAVADEFAAIAMATGPVPFDPELDGVEQVDDPLSTFGHVDVDPSTLDDDTEDDARDPNDPSDFDVFDPAAEVSTDAVPATVDGTEPTDIDESFGSGSGEHASPDPFGSEVAQIDDTLDLDDTALSFVVDEVLDPVDGVVDESVTDVDSVDLDTDEADPMDDDLDLAD